MTFSSVALGVAVLLSAAYTALGLMAYQHVNKEKIDALTPQLLAITLWWPFYDMYDEEGGKLCKYGRVVLPLAIAAYVVWFVNS
jgi:hypothetical protein